MVYRNVCVGKLDVDFVNGEKTGKNPVKTQNYHQNHPTSDSFHSIHPSYSYSLCFDSTAIDIGNQVNLSPLDFPNEKAFYNAIMNRIEGKNSFAGQMFYMVNLMIRLSER